MYSQANPWAIVLAAGEGRRLSSLTTANGVAVPKQFCSLNGGPSLLQEALERAGRVAPPRRVCTIVAAQHRRWWSAPLAALPAENVIVQPENRGTAIGVLLPLLRLELRDPRGRVVLLPADHHVRDEDTLARTLRDASRQLRHDTGDLLLLGIEPDEADPELGYIVPAAEAGEIRAVDRFVEKPVAALATDLVAQGAVWNSFIIVAQLQAMLRLYERRLPELVTELRRAVRRDAVTGTLAEVASYYADLPMLDFSRDVLEGQEDHLRVVTVPSCGWSDLGTPHRVAAALRRISERRTARSVAFNAIAHLDLAAQHAMQQMAG
ncbi:MAG TPA: sugar phosphate nucleotidyltransferase [Steroidobacteraceae bacterium]